MLKTGVMENNLFALSKNGRDNNSRTMQKSEVHLKAKDSKSPEWKDLTDEEILSLISIYEFPHL
jgi:hypothetical protein